jgi:flagellar biosynthesis/type III secretory pathway M-ring protein FliF/YscJ
MSERTFDRETILDLTVNVIPLGIILFFAVVFLLVRPWEQNLFISLISMGLLVVPFIGLALLTFVSGRAIAQAEGEASRAATGELSATDAELEEVESDDTNDYTMAEDRLETTEESEESDSDETEG